MHLFKSMLSLSTAIMGIKARDVVKFKFKRLFLLMESQKQTKALMVLRYGFHLCLHKADEEGGFEKSRRQLRPLYALFDKVGFLMLQHRNTLNRQETKKKINF